MWCSSVCRKERNQFCDQPAVPDNALCWFSLILPDLYFFPLPDWPSFQYMTVVCEFDSSLVNSLFMGVWLIYFALICYPFESDSWLCPLAIFNSEIRVVSVLKRILEIIEFDNCFNTRDAFSQRPLVSLLRRWKQSTGISKSVYEVSPP